MFKEREITVSAKQDIDFVVSPSGKYFFDPEVIELYNNYNDLLNEYTNLNKKLRGKEAESASIFGDPRKMRQQIVDLESQNRALITEVKLLRKCLDEASADRDKYKSMWQANADSRDKLYRQYNDTKKQLDSIKSAFDDYAKRESQIRSAQKPKQTCATCKWHDRKCYRPTSDNFGEITDDEYGCKRYESQ